MMLENTYLSVETFGNCKVCGRYLDLRFGTCFKCADRVTINKDGICEDTITGKKWVGEIKH